MIFGPADRNKLLPRPNVRPTQTLTLTARLGLIRLSTKLSAGCEPIARLENIMLDFPYYILSEFLTISTIVLLLISVMLAIILTFPIIMLLRYSIPANPATLERNKYIFFLQYNQTQSWNAKISHS